MPDHILGWVDIAIEQYLALPSNQQQLIDTRIQDQAAQQQHLDPEQVGAEHGYCDGHRD